MKVQSIAVLLVSSLVVAACGGGSSAPVAGPGPTPAPNTNTGVLKSVGTGVDACVSLNSEIKAMAEGQLRNSFASYPNPTYYGGGPSPQPGNVTQAAGVAASPSPAPAASDVNFSTTNIQVAGVDEMDWVKNDGQFLWTFEARNSQLRLTQTALLPANAMTKTAQIVWPQSIGSATEPNWISAEGIYRLSDGKIAAVMGGGSSYYAYWSDFLPVAAVGSTAGVSSAAVSNSASASSIAPYPGPGYSSVPPYTELKILQTQGSSFETQQTYTIKGRLIASRRLAASDAMVLITEAPIVWPKGLLWYPTIPASITSQAELTKQWPTLLQGTLDANVKLITAATLEQWLGQDAPPSQSECAGYVKADALNRLAFTRIATISPSKKTKTEIVVLTEGSGVYANTDSLYLTTRRWENFDGNPWQAGYTDVHRFSLSSEGLASYQASGKFTGWLLNRYAMDEIQQGGRPVLRVAASDRKITSPAPSFASQPYSYLLSFEQQGSKLNTLGQSDPIAPGESLQSAQIGRAHV